MPRPKKSECPEKPADEPVVEKTRKPRKKKEQSAVEPAIEKPAPKSAEKKKRVMSEKQLEALARGRESLAKRRQENKTTKQ